MFDRFDRNTIGNCETQNLAEYSDNMFQEKPSHHGAETIKNRRALCLSVFCPTGLSEMPGVRRLCMEYIVRIFGKNFGYVIFGRDDSE